MMSDQIKRVTNLVLAAVALAMGVAVSVLTIVSSETATIDFVRLLAIGVACLGLFALNSIPKSK